MFRKKENNRFQKLSFIGFILLSLQIISTISNAEFREPSGNTIKRLNQIESCTSEKQRLKNNYNDLSANYENSKVEYQNYNPKFSSAASDMKQKYNVLKRFESPLEALKQLRYKLENVANIAGQLDSNINQLSFQTENDPIFKLISTLERSDRQEAMTLANSLRNLQSSYRDPISQALRLSGASGLAGALKLASSSLNPIISELYNNYAASFAELRSSRNYFDQVQSWNNQLYNKMEEYRTLMNQAADAYNNWRC